MSRSYQGPTVTLTSGADSQTPRFVRCNLKDDVASYVRELIFSGKLKPDSKIPQDAVAEALGVSKLPVREALIVLEAEGLVVSYPRRGAFVAQLTPDDIYDHYHLFGLLVSAAAERAATRISDEELAELENILEKMEQWDSEESAEGQEEYNDEFHRIINRSGGSRRMNSVLRSIAYGIPDRLYHRTRGWTEGAQHEHRELLDALKERDPERAAKAAAAHIDSGAADAVRILRESGFWDET